jgi:alpha-tubulin suppressor-like RCC1 family protein
MKTTLCSSFVFRPASIPALLAALTLCLTTFPSQAQNDTVTISAGEFHRLVYSSHVLTEMANKPELDAVCQTLLELHRRNPTADPAALAGVLEQALKRFRTNAPVSLRSTEARDEILAVYLETLYQIPARTNFNMATLALLEVLLGRPGQNPPIDETPAALLHAGNQSFINAEDKLAQRQSLVDDCARRALGNASYRQAMDVLIGAESGVLFAHSAEQIITNNPALSANPAMRALLSLSQSTGDGRVEISMAAIDGLLTNEIQILYGTVETNRQVHLEILQRQGDLMAYLSDPGLVEAMALHEAARKDPQADLIVAAHASVNTLSELMKTRDVTRSKQVRALGNCWTALSDASFNWRLNSKLAAINQWNSALKFGKLSKGLTAGGGLAGVTMALVAGFAFPSPEQIMLEEIGKVKQMIFELGNDMHGRFDRVDGSLNTIQTTLDDTLATVNVLTNEVRQVRQDILDVQLDLHRLERQLFTSFTEQQRHNLKLAINSALFYENFNPSPMDWSAYSQSPNYENTFYTYATDFAANSISSPASFSEDDLADRNLQQQFAARPLSANLNYLKAVLYNRTGQAAFAQQPVLPNPQDWFVSAQAYLQLALENPRHFRDKGMRLPPILARGQELRNFLRALTFIGSSTNINHDLHTWLVANYESQLNDFTSQVRAQEQQYADAHDVPALENWRRWASAVPCVTASATTVLESRVEAPVVPPEFIPPGSPARVGIFALGGDTSRSHGLALQAGGAVAAWGDNNNGQSTVPAGLNNVMALAVGAQHSLALRQDGTVIAWGDSNRGKNTSPPSTTNVVAIGAGKDHNLAVRGDGRVVGWGYNYNGQATGMPTTGYPYASTGLVMVAGQTLTNVVAADGGFYYSLALRADGTVVTWGAGEYGETNVPPGLSDVLTIAAGGFHSLALHSNGTVTAWGINNEGQTNVPPGLDNVVAVAAGSHHSLALLSNGAVVAWGWNGYGQCNVPPDLTNAVAVAAGYLNSLALRSDGTLVVWGYNNWLWTQPIRVPEGLSNVVAIAAGSDPAGVALQADGRVVSWHDTYAIPADLADVVAISAGQTHRLALKTNGTVVAWGWNGYGECNVPGDLSSAVAVAAGSYAHSLALQADGRVRAWGYNNWKQRDVPSWLSNVVAIAAGDYFNLALRADGTVVGWGLNNQGQATGVPTTSYPFSSSGVVTLDGQPLTNVVAIAAGGAHSLALLASSTVRAWGNNSAGQCDVPQGLSNVVAIVAGYTHSLALRVDGSVVAWGDNDYGECNVPKAATNVVAVSTGFRQSLFLALSEAANPDASQVLRFVRSPVPIRLRPHLLAVNDTVFTYLDTSPPPAGTVELFGAKALLEAVVSLALPYTLERDDVLRGFLYGNEPLMELSPARAFLQVENARLLAAPDTPPALLAEVAALRHQRFAERLTARLNDLQATGQPEIPRLVGHTLRLLNLLRDSWASVPPPALELWSESNSPRLLLFGEPYARYTLQYRDTLSLPGWTTTATTNWRNEQIIMPPVSGGSQRFYRGLLPAP